jgi:agmatinase
MSQVHGPLFGLDSKVEEAKIVLIPVPIELTTSYGRGTSLGPMLIKKASYQLDIFHSDYGNLKLNDVALDDSNDTIWKTQLKYNDIALECIKEFDNYGEVKNLENLDIINKVTADVHKQVYDKCFHYLEFGKIPCVVGGDHSSPLGLIKALKEHHREFSILHIDAHFDLRESYQGFQFSHASIMFNAHNMLPKQSNIVQVGLRDFSEEEWSYQKAEENMVSFTDKYIKELLFRGESWSQVVSKIIKTLKQKVYISFDIDGLSPHYCPNTGTPVPGGLSFSQAQFLLKQIIESDKQIIGFDLCEVSSDKENSHNDWDANVGARVLFELCCQTLRSHSSSSRAKKR